jgi:hypothetical protein
MNKGPDAPYIIWRVVAVRIANVIESRTAPEQPEFIPAKRDDSLESAIAAAPANQTNLTAAQQLAGLFVIGEK